MIQERCNNCYWFDKCSSYDVCDEYTPIFDDDDDSEQRESFREEWFEYIEYIEDYDI